MTVFGFWAQLTGRRFFVKSLDSESRAHNVLPNSCKFVKIITVLVIAYHPLETQNI
jgi:lipid-A-disaccharide synthase-like uncharacterized protein